MSSSRLEHASVAANAVGASDVGAKELGTVPEGVLEPPSTEDCRRILKPECAMLLDGYLRRLARQEALARRVLGTLAQRLRTRRDHHRLGFARMRDYAAERLGISKRELQSLAATAAALADLPLTSRAFDVGRLCWTKARLVASIATPETERGWIEAAESATAAALQRWVAEERARGDAGSIAVSKRDSVGGAVEVDGARGSTVRLGAARSAPVVDPGRDAYLTSARSGDAGDDEGYVDGEPRAEVTLRCPARVRALWRRAVELARCVVGDDLGHWQIAETIAAEGLSARNVGPLGDSAADARVSGRRAREWAFRRTEARSEASTGTASRRRSDYDEVLDALRAMLDWSVIEEAIPAHIERLANDVSVLTPHQVDARLRAAMDALQRIDWQVGRLLHAMKRMRLYREIGFADFATYVRERLGISVRKAHGLVAIERRCGHTTYALSMAFERGEVSWLRALLLLPVISEEHGDAWIERARTVTLRRLAAEVEWARDLVACARGNLAAAPPPLGCKLGSEVGVVEVRGVDGCIEKVQFGAPLAQLGRPREEDPWVEWSARIRISGPMSVIELLMDAVAAFSSRDEAPWRGFERLLLHAIDCWNALPRHRDPVFERDGWRCAVPGCSTRRNLHDHHILFRSLGGGNELDNRVSVCAWHHKSGIHAGLIRAHGRVATGVTWEVGVRRGRPPLFAARDEVYVQQLA